MNLILKRAGLTTTLFFIAIGVQACPPEGEVRTIEGPSAGPGLVDIKEYWPMAKGNTWVLEDANWKHATWVLEDYWIGSTEVCKMVNERTDKWGTQQTIYHLLWRDDYVAVVREEAENNLEFLAPQFPGVSILFERFVDESEVDFSHENGDNQIYQQTAVINSVNQMLCGNATIAISPQLYPLSPTADVLVQSESNTAYCSKSSGLAITQIYAKGIGPISRHNLRIHWATIFDENPNGTEGNYTIYEFNSNGFEH